MKSIVSSLLVIVILMLSACHHHTLIEKGHSGSHFTLSRADSVTISLPENPTTGYSWSFILEPFQQDVIADISENYLPSKTNLAGSGGVKEYHFKAQNPGTVTITGYYYRPWEKLETSKADKVSYTFTVAP